MSSVCPGGEIEPGSPGLNVQQEGRLCKGHVAGEVPRVGGWCSHRRGAGERRERRQLEGKAAGGRGQGAWLWLCGWGLGINPKCDLAADFPTQLSGQLPSL